MVLPEPLGPMMPTLSPLMIVVVRSPITGRPPYPNVAPCASTTSLPERSASWIWILAVPTLVRRARRSSRSACSARTRPSLRVRRALIPWRTQTSSSASFLSKSACRVTSAASNSSRRATKAS